MVMRKGTSTYGFTQPFERALIAMLCKDTKLWGLVGRHLDPEAIDDATVKLGMRALKAIANDTGAGPSRPLTVIQRLQSWQRDGKLKAAEVAAFNDMLDDAEDAGLPTADELVAEVVPVLRQRMNQEATELALDDFAKKRPLTRTVELAARAERLGVSSVDAGHLMGEASFDLIAYLQKLKRIPCGIPELDPEIGGGLWRGGLGVVVGGAGEGKSIFLCHLTAEAWRAGLFVAYATLELSIAAVDARIHSNLTGIPFSDIESGARDADVRTRITDLRAAQTHRQAAILRINAFTPRVHTADDLKDWVAEIERIHGRKVDVLVVDYADKLGTNRKNARGEKIEDGYKLGELVYEDLRVWNEADQRWCWTASQKKGGQRKQIADVESAADSLGKGRVADMMITLNARDDGETMIYHVAKNRMGSSNKTIGPVPTDFALSRMCARND